MTVKHFVYGMLKTLLANRPAFMTLLCMVFVAATVPLFGENFITINGMVRDSHDTALSGVALLLKETSDGRESLTYSDADGQFVFEDLKEGHYELRMERKGFQAITAPIQLQDEIVRIVLATMRRLEPSPRVRYNTQGALRASCKECENRSKQPVSARRQRKVSNSPEQVEPKAQDGVSTNSTSSGIQEGPRPLDPGKWQWESTHRHTAS